MQKVSNIISLLLLAVTGNCWRTLDDVIPLNESSLTHPAVICDAGSTGTRVFAFHIPASTGADTQPIIDLVGRTNRGLSEFAAAGDFRGASDSVIPLLMKGITRLGPDVPIYLFATGGVRSLDDKLKSKLWSSIASDIPAAIGKLHRGTFELRTVEGIDEALYGLISSNFLLSDLPLSNLAKTISHPVGVLDLGGSSLEVSLVGRDNIVGSHDDFLRTYKSLGLARFRERIRVKGDLKSCEFGNVRYQVASVIPF
jgi:hypothetical protein